MSTTENLARAATLCAVIALPRVAVAQQSAPSDSPPSNADAAVSADASAAPTEPSSTTAANADGGLPSAERIVLRTGADAPADAGARSAAQLGEAEIEEFRRPGPGRAPVQLEHNGNPRAEFSLIQSEDEIPVALRRSRAPARRTLCRGNCLLYVPTTRATRVSATTDGSDVSADLTPPPEGIRVRFQQPSRGALVAAYVLYPTAAALAIAGAITAVLVRDDGVRLGSAVGLFSGAAVVLGVGITTNVVAFAGTVRTQPLRPSTP
ncbi:MAG: hypothetical protein JNK05_25475 [Myxococcales bacterium]|nr:hypothetical protein [Myxococcales bacterium]